VRYTSPALVSHSAFEPANTQVRTKPVVGCEVPELTVDAEPVVDPVEETGVATKRSAATTLPFRLVLVHGVL